MHERPIQASSFGILALSLVACLFRKTILFVGFSRFQGDDGKLQYLDTTTGAIVSLRNIKQPQCTVMRQNPYNAIICLGHARGTVTMWAPNEPVPAVKMLCHSGPVTAMAIDNAGTYICCFTASVPIFQVTWPQLE